MSEPLSMIPSGTRYYFGEEARRRRTIEETALAVFDGWSYEQLVTPTIDYYSLFEHGMGHMEAHRAFRFTDTDGRLLALRPDVTSTVARAAATLFSERERPLRFCYAAPAFRQQPQSHAEWRRESTQIGCELIGVNTIAADLEVLAIVCGFLRRLHLGGAYSITLSDVGIFGGVAERLALDVSSREELRRLIDIRNATDIENFLALYTSAEEGRAFAQLAQLSGKRETLDAARRTLSNEQSLRALDRLESLWEVIESIGVTDQFEIDLGDVARLDYYTGLTFKIYVEGAGARVGSGGRYDGLTASFGKTEPAVGFVVDLEALTDVLGAPAKTRGSQRPAPLPDDDASARFRAALAMLGPGHRQEAGAGGRRQEADGRSRTFI
jgi:ATP phosphoribosyltransferase regulatory subunit